MVKWISRESTKLLFQVRILVSGPIQWGCGVKKHCGLSAVDGGEGVLPAHPTPPNSKVYETARRSCLPVTEEIDGFESRIHRQFNADAQVAMISQLKAVIA